MQGLIRVMKFQRTNVLLNEKNIVFFQNLSRGFVSTKFDLVFQAYEFGNSRFNLEQFSFEKPVLRTGCSKLNCPELCILYWVKVFITCKMPPSLDYWRQRYRNKNVSVKCMKGWRYWNRIFKNQENDEQYFK